MVVLLVVVVGGPVLRVGVATRISSRLSELSDASESRFSWSEPGCSSSGSLQASSSLDPKRAHQMQGGAESGEVQQREESVYTNIQYRFKTCGDYFYSK